MITVRIATAFVVGGLAVGILTGSAGMIVLRDATSPNDVDSTAHMSQMGSMMPMTSAGSIPDSMQQHHVASPPEPTR